MVKELKKMLRKNSLSLEEYHHLFPRLMKGKYDVDTVSLFSYHLDFDRRNFVYSGFSSALLEERMQELEVSSKIANMAWVLSRSLEFSHEEDLVTEGDKQIHQRASLLFKIMVKCLQEADLVFWANHREEKTAYFEDFESVTSYNPEELQELSRTEVARKFAEVANRDIAGCCFPIETFLPELEEYLDPSGHDQTIHEAPLKYYWVGRHTQAFMDVGIVSYDCERGLMTYLVYVNNY